MNDTQKQGFAIKGAKGMKYLCECLGMTQPTLSGRLHGVSSFTLEEAEVVKKLYNELTVGNNG